MARNAKAGELDLADDDLDVAQAGGAAGEAGAAAVIAEAAPAFDYVALDSLRADKFRAAALICNVCELPMIVPVALPCNDGHMVCQHCVSAVNGTCPAASCGQDLGSDPQVHRLTRPLSKLILDGLDNLCSHAGKQCDWIGHRIKLAAHLESCSFTPCPHAVLNCSFLGTVKEVRAHAAKCPRVPIPCKHAKLGCKLLAPRVDVEKHEPECDVFLEHERERKIARAMEEQRQREERLRAENEERKAQWDQGKRGKSSRKNARSVALNTATDDDAATASEQEPGVDAGGQAELARLLAANGLGENSESKSADRTIILHSDGKSFSTLRSTVMRAPQSVLGQLITAMEAKEKQSAAKTDKQQQQQAILSPLEIKLDTDANALSRVIGWLRIGMVSVTDGSTRRATLRTAQQLMLTELEEELKTAPVVVTPEDISRIAAGGPIHLPKCDLSYQLLAGHNFNGAKLMDCDFSCSNLSGCRMVDAVCPRSVFNRAVLCDSSLSGCNFSGCDFRNTDLRGADFTGADLSRVVFTGANMRGATLTGAKLNASDLSDADLRDAQLQKADLTGAIMENTAMGGACLDGASAPHFKFHKLAPDSIPLRFTDADLSGADFLGVDWTSHRLQLKGARLSPANLNINMGAADMRQAKLSQTHVGGIDLRLCDLRGADLCDNGHIHECRLPSDLRDVKFNNSNLNGVDFRTSCVEGASFAGANIQGVLWPTAAVPVKADGEEVSVTGSSAPEQKQREQKEEIKVQGGAVGAVAVAFAGGLQLARCDFSGCDVSRMTFVGATLTGASFNNCDLTGLNFSGADLSRANFACATLTNTNLSNTNVAAADFSGANLIEAKLSDSNMAEALHDVTFEASPGMLQIAKYHSLEKNVSGASRKWMASTIGRGSAVTVQPHGATFHLGSVGLPNLRILVRINASSSGGGSNGTGDRICLKMNGAVVGSYFSGQARGSNSSLASWVLNEVVTTRSTVDVFQQMNGDNEMGPASSTVAFLPTGSYCSYATTHQCSNGKKMWNSPRKEDAAVVTLDDARQEFTVADHGVYRVTLRVNGDAYDRDFVRLTGSRGTGSRATCYAGEYNGHTKSFYLNEILLMKRKKPFSVRQSFSSDNLPAAADNVICIEKITRPCCSYTCNTLIQRGIKCWNASFGHKSIQLNDDGQQFVIKQAGVYLIHVRVNGIPNNAGDHIALRVNDSVVAVSYGHGYTNSSYCDSYHIDDVLRMKAGDFIEVYQQLKSNWIKNPRDSVLWMQQLSVDTENKESVV